MLVLRTAVSYSRVVILYLVLFFILGTAVGSFLNVVIDRTTRGQSILGRSYCDYCKATLKTLDLIPVVSFVGLGARCRYCKKPISWQYPIVEVLAGVTFALSFLTLTAAGQVGILALLYYFFVGSIMIVVSAIDLKYSLIPTSFVYSGSLIALFYNYFSLPSAEFVTYVLAAFGASFFFLIIFLITWGKGMGFGDLVLAFFMGMVLGASSVTLAIFLAFASGAAVSLFLIISGKKRMGQTVPFGPFLVLGFFWALFWGKAIINWYLMLY